jgi:DNA-binding NtrC family response regulator
MFPDILGNSRPMIELLEIIDRVAGTDTNILITGESGTGKEVVAKAIHLHSHRRSGAYQVIDCTAVPDSLFESMLFGHKKGSFTGAVRDEPGLLKQCDGGTAFFDELGELPLPMQAKLLRAVQEQTFTPVGSHTSVKVDTRFVCATNRDLEMEVSAGRFRQDLFYRLGVIHIELPPLRDRETDVILLAEHFLKSFSRTTKNITRLSDETKELFLRYNWPGNIRELRNVIERSVALCRGQLIQPRDLPGNIRRPAEPKVDASSDRDVPELPTIDEPPHSAGSSGEQPRVASSRDEAVKEAENRYLKELMKSENGNVSEAARVAGLSRQGLHKLLRQHNINAADYR